ncbi:MAG: hypothetical protein ABIX28_05585 [Vicinamibacterales bacterium]
MSTPPPKPFVQTACVCEKVLVESDGVPSLIRIVDTYTVELPMELPPGYKTATDLTVFVSLKSGDVVGEHEIGLRLNGPDGKARPVRRWPVRLNGQEHGANVRIAFTLTSPEYGLYWFDVLWGDEVLTRVPFRLKAKTPAAPSGEPTEMEPRQ